MGELFEIIIAIVAIVLTYKLISFSAKRITLLRRLGWLKKNCNAKITLHKWLFKPNSLISSAPDITVEIMNTVYAIRVYSGGSSLKSVHFASEEFSCVYMRLRASARAPQGTGANSLAMSSGINVSAKVYHTPKAELPPEYAEGGRRVVPVLILNPAPSVLSYVSDEKTSIKIAFTGDVMHGQMVFTADSFMRYADRMMREEERLLKDDPDEIVYLYNK